MRRAENFGTKESRNLVLRFGDSALSEISVPVPVFCCQLSVQREVTGKMAAQISEPQELDKKVIKPWRPWVPSIDDVWDAVEKVKANYANGFYRGTTSTILDFMVFVSTWQVWKLPFVHNWLLFIFSLGKNDIFC